MAVTFNDNGLRRVTAFQFGELIFELLYRDRIGIKKSAAVVCDRDSPSDVISPDSRSFEPWATSP